jgi:hypothetical protein
MKPSRKQAFAVVAVLVAPWAASCDRVIDLVDGRIVSDGPRSG